MLFYISLVAFFALLVVLMLHYRAALLPHVPTSVKAFFPRLSNYRYQPLSTFSEQISAGMSSSQFDIEANVQDGDMRSGLDTRGTEEVMEIMRRERVNFDQARLIRHNRILASNGIDASGMPMDSKAITHL